MELDKIMEKRLRGMAVRILSTIEHTVGGDLADLNDDQKFVFTGSDLKIIRGEILNAAGDTTRSLTSLVSSAKGKRGGGVVIDRDTIAALNRAHVDILEVSEIPVFKVYSDFNLLSKIRDEVGAGVVYNKIYTCMGIDDIVDSLMPYLDSVQIAGVKIADGEYRGWRDAICEMYLEDLGNE